MRKIDEYKTTDNRSVYNKLHKFFNANCDRCRWNRGCNSTKQRKGFGGYDGNLKYPSWKDCTKNRKQWQNKNLKIKKKTFRYSKDEYIEISW